MEHAECKVGEIQWKIHISVVKSWIRMSLCLAYLMVMEVKTLYYLNTNLGKEVALYVKERYIEEMKKLPSFQKKDYYNALRESFIKIDELLVSP